MMHTGPYGTCAALYTRVTFASCKTQTTLTSPAPCSKTHMHARTSFCLKKKPHAQTILCFGSGHSRTCSSNTSLPSLLSLR